MSDLLNIWFANEAINALSWSTIVWSGTQYLVTLCSINMMPVSFTLNCYFCIFVILKPCKYLRVSSCLTLDTQSFISYVQILWTVEDALLCSTKLSKTWYKALLLYINLVNNVIGKSWALPMCFVCKKYFFIMNIFDILLTIIQIYWSGISQLTRNVIQKAFSF